MSDDLEEEWCGYRFVTGDYCPDWKELSRLYKRMHIPLEKLREILCKNCGWRLDKEAKRDEMHGL